MEHLMIYPVAALVLLTAIMGLRSYHLNTAAARAREVRISQFRIFEEGNLPPRIMLTARNVSNLFEYPVTFYVLAILLILFHRVNVWYLAAAWTYVLLRALHSYIHVTTNNVIHRFRAFGASCFLLWFTWAAFVVHVLIDTPTAGAP
jgi:hypothetical protein